MSWVAWGCGVGVENGVGVVYEIVFDTAFVIGYSIFASVGKKEEREKKLEMSYCSLLRSIQPQKRHQRDVVSVSGARNNS